MEASVEAILLTEAYTAASENAPSSEMPTPDLVERPKTPMKGEVMFKLWSRFSASDLFRRRKRDKKSNSKENRMARNSVTYFAEALTASSSSIRRTLIFFVRYCGENNLKRTCRNTRPSWNTAWTKTKNAERWTRIKCLRIKTPPQTQPQLGCCSFSLVGHTAQWEKSAFKSFTT